MAQQWGEVDCPKCKNAIKAKALLCPHCGAEFTREEAAIRAQEQYRTMGIGCVGLIAILALVWWAFSGDSNRQKATETAKTEVAAKTAKWDKVAILKSLESCQAGEKVIKRFVDRRDRRGAYKAAIGSKNACSRAMIESSTGPYECTEVAMYGIAYYNDLAGSIDTLSTAPSVLEGIEGNKRIFAKANVECTVALAKAGGLPEPK